MSVPPFDTLTLTSNTEIPNPVFIRNNCKILGNNKAIVANMTITQCVVIIENCRICCRIQVIGARLIIRECEILCFGIDVSLGSTLLLGDVHIRGFSNIIIRDGSELIVNDMYIERVNLKIKRYSKGRIVSGYVYNSNMITEKDSSLKIKDIKGVESCFRCQKEGALKIIESELRYGDISIDNSIGLIKDVELFNTNAKVMKGIVSFNSNSFMSNKVGIWWDISSGSIEDCKFKNIIDVALRICNSTIDVKNNEIISSTQGITISNHSNPNIINCKISNCKICAISIADFSCPLIMNLKIENTPKGIITYNSSFPNISSLSLNNVLEALDTSTLSQLKLETNYPITQYIHHNGLPFSLISNIPILTIPILPISLQCSCGNDVSNIRCYQGHLFCDRCISLYKKCPICSISFMPPLRIYHNPTCVICYTKNTNTICLPCGHICMCYDCALEVYSSYMKCPLCSQDIKSFKHIFN
jgi:hypothetical protein